GLVATTRTATNLRRRGFGPGTSLLARLRGRTGGRFDLRPNPRRHHSRAREATNKAGQELGPAADAELAIEPVDVLVGRRLAGAEARGQLFLGIPLPQTVERLLQPRR